MRVRESRCASCPPEMGCLGSSCRYRSMIDLYCDDCKEWAEELYDVDGKELCKKCVLSLFPKVRIDDDD